MIKVVFMYEVESEKQHDYLEATVEKIKPFWEAQGCQSYNVWQEEDGNKFIKEMIFPDSDARNKVVGLQSDEANSIRALWKSFLTEFTMKTYIKKI